jgi:hypothetical protein
MSLQLLIGLIVTLFFFGVIILESFLEKRILGFESSEDKSNHILVLVGILVLILVLCYQLLIKL